MSANDKKEGEKRATRTTKKSSEAAAAQTKVETTKKPTTTSKPSNRGRAKGSERVAGSGRTKATFESEVERFGVLFEKDRKINVEFNAEIFLEILTELVTPEFDEENQNAPRFKTLSCVLNSNRERYPTRQAFYNWMARDTTGTLRKAYDAIMESNYDMMHDEIFRVAYDITHDIEMCERGGILTPQWNKLFVQRGKLIIDSIQWTITRLGSAKYSPNLKIEHTGEVNPEFLSVLAENGAYLRQIAAANYEKLQNELLEEAQKDLKGGF